MTNLTYSLGASNLLAVAYQFDAGDRLTNEVWTTGQAGVIDGILPKHQGRSTKYVLDASYRYDKAGNPLRRTELGLGVTNSFNHLNQIVAGVSTGGVITVAGAVIYNAGTVTVNGVTADRTGLYYERPGVVLSTGTNLITAVYHGPGFTNHPNIVTAMTQVVVGQAAYTHDPNGNLTADANFLYRYDALNQLTNVVTKLGATNLLANRYDGLGRRVQATTGGTNIVRYVYLPGTFLVLATLDGANNLLETFTHGPDLSGTLGGAGGIGGILSQTKHQGQSTTHFLHSDAMGNVVMTTDGSGNISSTYRYTPFGRPYAKTGPFASRFSYSSKEFDGATGLGYWGYRFYSPGLGRWVNRDPIGENGGVNLFTYAYNTACNSHDSLGLCWSNARALAHYLNPLAKRRVSLEETGCLANVSHGLISKFDEIWSLIHRVAIKEVTNKKCGDLAKHWSKHGTTRDSAQTTVYWIGGISLAIKYNCDFITDRKNCTASYECRTEISMDDAFEHPLDFNGRVRIPLPGHGGPDVAIKWPDPKVDFGFVYHVYHTWHDEIRNTLKCK